MEQERARGSCYCGRIRFEVDMPSKFVAHCHCANCRRAHGAGAVTWVGFPSEQFRVVEGAEDLARYETDTDATRSFCRVCGSTLLFESPRWAGEVHVARANIDEPVDSAPAAHAFADRSPEWFPITDELPRYGGESGTERLS